MRSVQPRARLLLEGFGISAVDVVMNLFVFFFVAFSLLATFAKKKQAEQERAQEIQLPRSGRDTPPPDASLVTVELALDGSVRVDGVSVEDAEVTRVLRGKLGEPPRGVVVRAHRELSLGMAIGLLDRVWAAEPASVSIATVREAHP